jgi:hypothetical protein
LNNPLNIGTLTQHPKLKLIVHRLRLPGLALSRHTLSRRGHTRIDHLCIPKLNPTPTQSSHTMPSPIVVSLKCSISTALAAFTPPPDVRSPAAIPGHRTPISHQTTTVFTTPVIQPHPPKLDNTTQFRCPRLKGVRIVLSPTVNLRENLGGLPSIKRYNRCGKIISGDTGKRDRLTADDKNGHRTNGLQTISFTICSANKQTNSECLLPGCLSNDLNIRVRGW